MQSKFKSHSDNVYAKRGHGSDMRTALLLVAAGRGSRIASTQDQTPKQYRLIGGRMILSRTLDALLGSPELDCILPVIHADDTDAYAQATAHLTDDSRVLSPVYGGKTRQESVRRGLEALREFSPELVLIHDGARPFVSHATISDTIKKLRGGARAVVACLPVTDTLKRGDDDDRILGTVDRKNLWAAQTPQGFDYAEILAAHNAARAAGMDNFTDDGALAEWRKIDVTRSAGDPENVKITTMADIRLANQRLHMENKPTLNDIRVGNGYDVHAFEAGGPIILGGVEIDHERKLKGHSDADVVLHALTDAILGALAAGDIGSHFPPSDAKWKGAASDQFLKHAVDLVKARDGVIAHLDATVVCEAPKIGPHRDAMRARIAEICALELGRVSVKATTSERLGFTGRKEGIAALATATIRLP